MNKDFPWMPILTNETASVGDGYNLPTSEIVPKQLRRSTAAIVSEPCAYTDYEVVIQTDHLDACSQLRVSAELKISVLCGLFSLSGTGEYAKTDRKATKQCSFTIVAVTQSETEKLGTDSANDWDEDLMQQMHKNKHITHVIGKVLYGANATLTVTYELSESENESEIRGSLGVTAQWVAVQISGKGSVAISDAETKRFSKLQVRIKTDSAESSDIPTTFEAAISAFKGIVSRLHQSQRVKAFQILPVSYILRREDNIRYEIKEQALNVCLARMRQLHALQSRVDIASKQFEPYAAAFPSQSKNLGILKDLLLKESLSFNDALQSTLKRVRIEGSVDATSELIKCAKADVNFQWRHAERFVDCIEKECRWFQGVYEDLKTNIDSPFCAGQVNQAAANPPSRLVFTLGSRIHGQLPPFLNDNRRDEYDDNSEHWIEDQERLQAINQLRQRFITFAAYNKSNGVLFTAEHVKGKEDPVVLLYKPEGQKAEVFHIPSPPALQIKAVTAHDVSFSFPQAEGNNQNVTHWTVSYRMSSSAPSEKNFAIDAELFVGELAPETEYEARVKAVTVVGESDFGVPVKFKTTEAPGACCTLVSSCERLKAVANKGTFYQLPLEEYKRLDDIKPGKPPLAVVWKRVVVPTTCLETNAEDLVFLIVGQTGVGKSTQMNAMANYIFGVRENCDHRFVLVPEPENAAQGQSVTQEITVYTIPYFEGNRIRRVVHLIDPPGCNDTRGLEYDHALVKMFQMLYDKQPVLHCIAFLALAGQPRLTADQVYVLDEITRVFGVGVKGNFVGIFTKSDFGRLPEALISEVRAKGVELGPERILRTNNVSFTMSEDVDNTTASLQFQISIATNKIVFDVAQSLEPVTTDQSLKVVERRADLSDRLQQMEMSLNTMLHVLDELLQMFKIIKDADPKKPQQKIVKTQERIKVQVDHYITFCYKCFHTCHDKCTKTDSNLCSMMKDGRCKVCPGRCRSSQHSSRNFIETDQEKIEYVDDAELLARFAGAVSEHVKKEAAIAKLLEDYIAQMDIVADHVHMMHESHAELAEIALNPSSLTPKEFLEKLKQKVESDKHPGFTQKAEQLQSLIRQQEYAERFKAGFTGDARDEIAELKRGLESAVTELRRMSRLSADDFETVRSQETKYKWCQAPCTWNEALKKMMQILETLLNKANGIKDGADSDDSSQNESGCSIM